MKPGDKIGSATVVGVKESRLPDGKPAERTSKADCRMNKTEQQYAWFLDDQLKNMMIERWRFESIKLRLADDTWYTPDFCVMVSPGWMVMVEIKGFLRDDAAVKFKVAREMYPEFGWMMLSKRNGAWYVKMGEGTALLIP
jgi:hypothetical protein